VLDGVDLDVAEGAICAAVRAAIGVTGRFAGPAAGRPDRRRRNARRALLSG
jgi:hypothetical protein